jgi:predicted RecA/RadA family phage recombinase
VKNYSAGGDVLQLIAPAGGVTSGRGVLYNDLFVVAMNDAAVGAVFSGLVTGVVTLPKAAQAWVTGRRMFWDDTAKVITSTSSGNTRIGMAISDALVGDATAKILFYGMS